MPSGNSCRQTSVSTQLARIRRAAWHKVVKTFTHCCRSCTESDDALDEYIPSLDATNTTPILSPEAELHPSHMISYNKQDAQHPFLGGISNNIKRRSLQSHTTVNIWAAYNNNSTQQSHVTLFTVVRDQTYPLTKVTHNIIRSLSYPSSRDLLSHSLSPGGLLLPVIPPEEQHLTLPSDGDDLSSFRSNEITFPPTTSYGVLFFICRKPEEKLIPATSSDVWPLARTSPWDTFKLPALFSDLVFSTFSREGRTDSTSSGAFIFYFFTSCENAVTSLTSFASCIQYSPTPREMTSGVLLRVEIYYKIIAATRFSLTPRGQLFTSAVQVTSTVFLAFPTRVSQFTSLFIGKWIPTPQRFQPLSTNRKKERVRLVPSLSWPIYDRDHSAQLDITFKDTTTFDISPIFSKSFFASTPRGQLFTRSVPVTSTLSLPFPRTVPQFTSLVIGERIPTPQRFQPLSTSRKKERVRLVPSLSWPVYDRDHSAQLDITFKDTATFNISRIFFKSFFASTPRGQLFTRSVPVTSTLSLPFPRTVPQFTSLVIGKRITTTQQFQPQSTLRKKERVCLVPSLPRQALDSDHQGQDITFEDTTAFNTASIFSDCFNASHSTVSETSSQAEVADISSFSCDESFYPSPLGAEFARWHSDTNHTNVSPTEKLVWSWHWVADDDNVHLNIKSTSLPVCANGTYSVKAFMSKLHILASSLPAVVGGDEFIQETASLQSECFILSNSTIASTASHQKLTAFYPLPLSHRGCSFTFGYSASWDFESFNSNRGFTPQKRSLSRTWNGLHDFDHSDEITKAQSLPVYVMDKDDQVFGWKISTKACSLPTIISDDKRPEYTVSCNSGWFNLSQSSNATNPGSERNFEVNESFQKDAWSSCSASNSSQWKTTSCLSDRFSVSDGPIPSGFSKDVQHPLTKSYLNYQSSRLGEIPEIQETSDRNYPKCSDHSSSTTTGKHETSNHHQISQKEMTKGSGRIPRTTGQVIGLADAPHLVKNILKGLSAEGDHQTFKSIPTTCPIIPPLDLADECTILGEGSFGMVHLMKHLPTMKLAAVKVPKEDLKRDRIYENFYREVNILSSLWDLDCVPQLFGVSRAGSNLDMPILVQQFIGDQLTYETMTLQWAILKGLLSSRKAVCIALQVCNGVAQIHSRGILHCDLKVDNIMLVPGSIDAKQPQIKIIDFGMAVFTNESPKYENIPTQYQEEVGKKCLHLAPEVLRGAAPYSKTSEIYSLGLILKNLAVFTGIFLKDLGQRCMEKESTRPQIKDIIHILESKASFHHYPP